MCWYTYLAVLHKPHEKLSCSSLNVLLQPHSNLHTLIAKIHVLCQLKCYKHANLNTSITQMYTFVSVLQTSQPKYFNHTNVHICKCFIISTTHLSTYLCNTQCSSKNSTFLAKRIIITPVYILGNTTIY